MHNGACANYTCTWSIPSNATLVSWSDQNLTSNVENKLYESEAEAKWKKCAYVCNESAWYSYLNGQCVPDDEPDPNDDEYEWACYGSCEALKLDFETFIDRCTANVYYRSNLFCNREFWLMGEYDCTWKNKNQCEDASGICKRTPFTTSICVSNDDAKKMREWTLEWMAEGVICWDDTVDQVSDCPCTEPQLKCGDDPLAYESPQCWDAKYTCTPWTASNKKWTNSSYSWTCSNGWEKVSCEIGISCYKSSNGGICGWTRNWFLYYQNNLGHDVPCDCRGCPNYQWPVVGECDTCCLNNNIGMACNSDTKLGCERVWWCSWIENYAVIFDYCYKIEWGSKSTTIDNKSSWCGWFSCGVATPWIINNSSIDVCTWIPIPSNSYCFDNGDKCEEDASKKYGSSNIWYLCQNYGYDTRWRGCYCYR